MEVQANILLGLGGQMGRFRDGCPLGTPHPSRTSGMTDSNWPRSLHFQPSFLLNCSLCLESSPPFFHV